MPGITPSHLQMALEKDRDHFISLYQVSFIIMSASEKCDTYGNCTCRSTSIYIWRMIMSKL